MTDIGRIAMDDQALAAVKTMAQMTAAYRRGLEEEGNFSKKEVWELTVVFVGSLMRQNQERS